MARPRFPAGAGDTGARVSFGDDSASRIAATGRPHKPTAASTSENLGYAARPAPGGIASGGIAP
jgi:hypothetical protein